MIESSQYRDRIYDSYVHARGVPLVREGGDNLNSRRPYMRAMIRRHFPRDIGSAVLDLGCGHGAAMYFVREAGYQNVRGVDRSPEQVSEAKRLGIDNVHEGDLLQAVRDTADQSFDVVLTFDVIEHLRRDELLALVDGVRRILRPNGKWIVHTPNAESPFFGRIRYGDLTHEQAFTRTSMGQLLLSSGFRTYACFEDAPIIHGIRSGLRLAIWKALRGMMRLYLAAETGSTDSSIILSQNFLVVATK